MNLLRIAARIAAAPVELQFLDWYPGNNYSDGDFAVKAETPHGSLKGEGLIGPEEGVFEDEWALDGERLPPDVDPALDLPGGSSPPARLEKFPKTMNREVEQQLEDWSADFSL